MRQALMTVGLISTAVVRMRITLCVKRVIDAAPRPSCTAWPWSSSASGRHSIQAIMRCTYSSSIASGLRMRIAPCTQGVPRCR